MDRRACSAITLFLINSQASIRQRDCSNKDVRYKPAHQLSCKQLVHKVWCCTMFLWHYTVKYLMFREVLVL